MTVTEVIAKRRSCRRYRSEPVAREHVQALLEAARLAPSACNRQPWRFAVVTEEARRRAVLRKGLRAGILMRWAEEAPVLVVIGMVRSLTTHRLAVLFSGVDYPWIDIGIAGEHLVLQAEELGLGTCWIGWVNPSALRRVLGWPRTGYPAAIITVGHPADGAPPAPTPRKPLTEIAEWVS